MSIKLVKRKLPKMMVIHLHTVCQILLFISETEQNGRKSTMIAEMNLDK